jgi:predicted small metal-binding protein
MAYTLACKDFGVECDYIANGETEDEVLKDGAKHAIEAHGYTEEQIKDPKFIEDAKKLINQT